MKDNWVWLTVGQTIFRSCQFVGRNWELFVEFERVKSDERILNGWSLVKQGLVLVQTSLALLLDAQMQLRRWSSCSGGRRNAFPGWWMIQRLKFINSLAFLDVLAISRVYHQSLHHLDAAQTVEGGQHRRGWMHLQRLINDSNGIRSFKHLASIGSVRLDFAQDLKLLEEIYLPFYSKVCQTKQH